jgi:aspartyl-tRNA(Asn)/glutamyl-tRNA(Gln) amidotransferase subunit A
MGHSAEQIGATALARVDAALARIDVENSSTHVFMATCRGAARDAASAADHRQREGRRIGSLDGCIVGIKDNLAVRGLPRTLGFGCYRDLLAEHDAHAVRRLRDAGAIILGTLNMHEGALGGTSNNPHFGACQNPLQAGLTPGGSSGGSAAAVAAGLVDVALGSDTMGSVRLPAAYCGVVGMKPSYGLIGRSGMGLLCPGLDTVGPLCRSAQELWPAYQALLGDDADDPDWLGGSTSADQALETVDLSALRFGVPEQLILHACDAQVWTRFQFARRAIEQAGASVVDIELKGWDPAKHRRAGLLLVEAQGAALWPELIAAEYQGVSDGFKAMLRYGRDASSTKLIGALDALRYAQAAFARAISGVDAILMPSAPQLPFAHGTPVPVNQADLTALANFAGAPAISTPIWLDQQALPGSLQLIAARGRDAELIAIAAAVETILPARPIWAEKSPAANCPTHA